MLVGSSSKKSGRPLQVIVPCYKAASGLPTLIGQRLSTAITTALSACTLTLNQPTVKLIMPSPDVQLSPVTFAGDLMLTLTFVENYMRANKSQSQRQL